MKDLIEIQDSLIMNYSFFFFFKLLADPVSLFLPTQKFSLFLVAEGVWLEISQRKDHWIKLFRKEEEDFQKHWFCLLAMGSAAMEL